MEPCVLIVSEDYSRIRGGLREAGFTTAGLPDAEAARTIFDSLRPLIVISDVELTTVGRRTLPYFIHVLSKYPRTPLIGIAGDDFSQETLPPAERFNEVLRRPVHMPDLAATVLRLVGGAC